MKEALRSEPESPRLAWICSPLRNHFAIRRGSAALAAVLLLGNASSVVELRSGSRIAIPFGPKSEQNAVIRLHSGESADVAVSQGGIDVVVTLRAPDGALIDEIDSPNGRNGDEPVSIFARTGGAYTIHVRPISSSEPQGKIEVRVDAFRSVTETSAIRRQEDAVRSAAAEWLRRNDAALPPINRIASAPAIGSFDELAESAQLIGLGEATHGSREFGDIRLGLVKRLVERHGFRVIAVEDSIARWRALEPYVAGAMATPATAVEWGWIGRRSRKELLEWVRSWNLLHPVDRVRIVGVDPQDDPFWPDELGPLLNRAYGEAFMKAWQPHQKELAAANEQTQVFGNSAVAESTRNFLQDLLARVTADAPLLKHRLGGADYERTLDYVRQLAAFADFNSRGGPLAKSRDWYMALATLRAVETGEKAIYWAHNSHVSTAATPWGPSGALLRAALGCRYRAVATTFGRGSFLAQIPNDPADRLRIDTVPAAKEDSIEAVLARVRPGMHIASWQCGASGGESEWLREARPMRWVGGLYDPNSAPSGSYRSYHLTAAFDSAVYVPLVQAEADPGDRPIIPARKQ